MFSQARMLIFCIGILLSDHAFCRNRAIKNYPENLPSSSLYDLSGKEFTLEKLEGNVLIVHFWATWCASCVDELKSLNKLQKLLRKDRVIVIPISEDFKGVKVIKSFYNKFNLRFLPAFVDKNNRWFREMKVSALPTTFIINSQGMNVMSVNSGFDWLDKENIALIKKYISAKQPYNPDYVSLINDHAVVIDKPKLQSTRKNSGGENILRSIETDLAPAVEEDKLMQGEIGMANVSKDNFTNRRSVNLDHNKIR